MKVYFAHILVAFVFGRSSAENNLLRHGALTTGAASGHRFATGTDLHVCSDEDEVVLCDPSVDKSCQGMKLSDCNNVFCQGNYACKSSEMSKSIIDCTGHYDACAWATFRESTVKCWKESSSNCSGAKFYASAVTCEHSSQHGYTRNCKSAQFNQCSCCEGVGCPDGALRCYDENNSSDAFCATELSGKTCREWGNPICNEDGVSSANPLEISSIENIPRSICVGQDLNDKPVRIATVGTSQGSFKVDHGGELPPGVTCVHDDHGDSNSEVEVYLGGSPEPTITTGLYEIQIHASEEGSTTARSVSTMTSKITLRFSHCTCRKYRCRRGKFQVCRAQTAINDSKTVCVGFRKARRLLKRGGFCGQCGN